MRSRSAFSLALLLAACSSSPARRDGPPDAAPDRGRDRALEGIVLADLGADRGPDLRAPDYGPPPDGGSDAQPAAATVLYTVASDPESFGLRTVVAGALGPGPAQPVAGWQGYLDLEPLSLTTLQEILPVSADRPQPMRERNAAFQGIRLPGGKGTLHYVHRKLLGTSGLLLVRSDGTLSLLLEVSGLYAETIADRIALDEKGELGAAVIAAGPKAVLFRTDGKSFANGKSSHELAATPAPKEIRARSLTLAGPWLYLVARSDGVDTLLRAPSDGSGPLAVVSLPPSGGQPPVSLADQLALSADGSTLALAAGASAGQRDLYSVAVASGTATRVTDSPTLILERGDSFGALGAQLALSPAGGVVAYVAELAGTRELFVAKSNGSGPPVQVSGAAAFASEVTDFHNLVLPDESNLVFLAGVSPYELEVFRWSGSAGQVSILSAPGAKGPPFSGKGMLSPQAAWLSPSRSWLYLIGYIYASQIADLHGVNLKSFAATKITNAAQVQWSPGSIAACPSSGALYFAAKANAVNAVQEVWSFDQEQGKPAQKLTSTSPTSTGPWYLFELTLAPGCGSLVWAAGGGYYLRDLWSLPTVGPPFAKKLTPAPTYLGGGLVHTPDRLRLIYGAGGGDDALTLKAIRAGGGAVTTLDPTAGSLQIFSVY